jgi:hypothetical protein
MSSLFVAFFSLVASSFRTRAALQTEGPRASSPTHRSRKERAASFAPPALRPALVGLALATVALWAL